MKDMENLRERFLRDPLPRRLGGIAATMGRISSSARNSTDSYCFPATHAKTTTK